MFKITEYVNASSIWPTAKDYEDMGERAGLCRGYNVEVTNGTKTDWLSCSWFEGDHETYFNDDFHTLQCEEMGWSYTGRICFRGYGIEMYDPEERDYYIVMADSEEGQKLLERRASFEEEEDSEEEFEEDDYYDEPSDLELGFNPYMGCYDYDC